VIADTGCLPELANGYPSRWSGLLTVSAEVHALDSGTGCLRQLPYPGWRACGSRLGPEYTHAAQGLARSAWGDRSSNRHEYFELGIVTAHTSKGVMPRATGTVRRMSGAPVQVRRLALKAPLLRSGVMLHWSACRGAREGHQ